MNEKTKDPRELDVAEDNADNRKRTPTEVDLRVRINMQFELFEERYGHWPTTDEDMLRWQTDGYGEKFRDLLHDPDVQALVHQKDFDGVKAKIREKLF